METITIKATVNITLQNTSCNDVDEYRYVVFEMNIYGEWCTTKRKALNSIKAQLSNYKLN